MTRKSSRIMEQHVVAFIDLLGFSEAVDAPDPRKLNAVLELMIYLREFAGQQGEKRARIPNVNGLYPEVSTFSDHILFSLPIPKSQLIMSIVHMSIMATAVARLALRAGFLVRGAISSGKLYHHNGVAFGPALVRAASLESKLAVNPRIIIDPSMVAELSLPTTHFFRDQDGLWCADYLFTMLLEDGSQRANIKSLDDYKSFRDGWYMRLETLADDEIRRLSRKNSGHGREKWQWFRNDLVRTKDHLRGI